MSKTNLSAKTRLTTMGDAEKPEKADQGGFETLLILV
jgi:hypothetical protein